MCDANEVCDAIPILLTPVYNIPLFWGFETNAVDAKPAVFSGILLLSPLKVYYTRVKVPMEMYAFLTPRPNFLVRCQHPKPHLF